MVHTLVNASGSQTSHSTILAPSKNCPYKAFPSGDVILDSSLTKAMVLYPCLTLSRTVDFPMYPDAPAMMLVLVLLSSPEVNGFASPPPPPNSFPKSKLSSVDEVMDFEGVGIANAFTFWMTAAASNANVKLFCLVMIVIKRVGYYLPVSWY